MKNSSHIGAEPSPTPAGADGAPQPPAPRIAPAASAPREWPAFQVERRPFADLRRDPRNARVHSPEQVRQIALAMREWGWTTALLIDETGLIIAGHGRLDAAELNRAELPQGPRWQAAEAPVIVARGWTAAQKRAYALADNQIALNASWNDDLLRFELGELGTLDFDLGLIGSRALERVRSRGVPPSPRLVVSWRGGPEEPHEQNPSPSLTANFRLCIAMHGRNGSSMLRRLA